MLLMPDQQQLKRFYCLSGCTAVGKTELALQWAEANGAEIVNCDSLLFYKGMDIGTAKPTAAELERVPHHLIDIVEPHEQMDIGRFVDLAIGTIAEIQSRGKKALVTGGSGFYLKAFFMPVVDSVKVSDETRAKVTALVKKGLKVAVAELLRLNSGEIGNLDTNNSRRVVKSLERCIESGNTLKELNEAFSKESNALIDAEKQLTILERDRDELNERIALRVGQMLDGSLIAEVEQLLTAGFERNLSASGAIGYREVIAHLRGELDREAMVEQICVNTRRLAKKQRTWFRGQLPKYAKFVDTSGGREVALDDLFSRR